MSVFTHLPFLTPKGLFHLAQSFFCEGITLMSLLRFASKCSTGEPAFVSKTHRYSYQELYGLALRMTHILYYDYGVRRQCNVGILCRNSTSSILALIASSRLGANVKLVNTDLSSQQVQKLLADFQLGLLIYDEEVADRSLPDVVPCKMVSATELSNHLFDNANERASVLPAVVRGGTLTVLTGGSGGAYKEASRRSHVLTHLPPLLALIKDVKIQTYRSVLLALPIYHGFGLAALIISMLLGKTMCVMNHFDASSALDLIEREEIEILPLVPAMLSRIWQQDEACERTHSLRCIICGGDRLDRKLVATVVGNRSSQSSSPISLFNLYGTSEAGFFMLATPADLAHEGEVSIGRPIMGVKCQVRNCNPQGVGTLWVKTGWAMTGRQNRWQNTGDLVRQTPQGLYYYKGRADRMVVCGGENVYPESVEQILVQHPRIVAANVYAAPHPQFGFVLQAQVEASAGVPLAEAEILRWLRPQLSRAEMPHKVTVGAIALLSTGKREMKNGAHPSSSE